MAEFYNGNIYIMSESGTGILRLATNTNGSIKTSSSDFKLYSTNLTLNSSQGEKILGFGFLNDYLVVSKNSYSAGTLGLIIQRFRTTTLNAGTGTSISLLGRWAAYDNWREYFGNYIPKYIYSNTRTMYTIRFSSNRPQDQYMYAFVPFPTTFDHLKEEPQSMAHHGGVAWVGYNNSNKLEAFDIYNGLFHRSESKDITLTNLTSPSIRGLTVIGEVLYAVDYSQQKSVCLCT